MDKYHTTSPPTELKSSVLGREGSRKKSEKLPDISENLEDLTEDLFFEILEEARESYRKFTRSSRNAGIGSRGLEFDETFWIVKTAIKKAK